MESSNAYILGSNGSSDKEDSVRQLFKVLTSDEQLDYFRGYFDTNGQVLLSLHELDCIVKCISDEIKILFKEFFHEIPFNEYENKLVFRGVNAIEFMDSLYQNADYSKYNHNYATYKDVLYCWKPNTYMEREMTQFAKFKYHYPSICFKFRKTLPDALAPEKAHVTDTGYDLHLVKKIKEENGMVLYDTGIAVQPPIGYYFELVGRSSISKSGYIMANSVGIIDASYTGSLKVALIKINKKMPDLEFPCRLVQLIPRQFVHLEPVEVEDINTTQRADGGFGSSG